jgi:DNA-binding transcriptional MerR regulator
MSGRSYLSIGDVLTLLRLEFPDVTISKIRFLESQGLVNPERTPSGYRKFYEHDVERLRWVLRQQREHFLPLKVIKDRLGDGAGVATPSDDRPKPTGSRRAVPGGNHVVVTDPEPEAEAEPDVDGHLQHEPRTEPVFVGMGAGAGPGTRGPLAEAGPGPARPSAAPTPTLRSIPPERTSSQAAVPTELAGTSAPPLPESPTRASVPPPPAHRGSDPVVVAQGPPGGSPGKDRSRQSATPTGMPPDPPSRPAVTARSSDRPEAGGMVAQMTVPTQGPSGATGSESTPANAATSAPTPPLPRAAGGGSGPASLTLDELATACGLDLAAVEQLREFGLLTPYRVGGIEYYDDEAFVVGNVAAAFARYGVEPRHLRLYKNAAEREAGFIEQIVLPLVRQRNPEARTRAQTTADELTQLGQNLRSSLLRKALRDLLGG